MPIPTIPTDRRITVMPATMVALVLKATPLHSFWQIPQKFAVSIIGGEVKELEFGVSYFQTCLNGTIFWVVGLALLNPGNEILLFDSHSVMHKQLAHLFGD